MREYVIFGAGGTQCRYEKVSRACIRLQLLPNWGENIQSKYANLRLTALGNPIYKYIVSLVGP